MQKQEKVGKQLHGDQYELTIPRISGRQRHRSNPPSSTSEEYYRITVYDEFLSHVVSELERFVNNPSHSITIGLPHLLPSECIKLGNDVVVPEDLAKAVDLFKGDLPHAVMFNTEYNSWVCQWKELSSSIVVPDTLVGVLKECSILSYPNLNALLILALTLPITSCESERSFSQLKLIKTARRTTMSESQLSSLVLMINLERCSELLSEQNMKELVQSFGQLHPRRMKLPFMLCDE